MTALSIYLFGSVQVVRDDHDPVKLRPTAKAMLAYLLLNRNQAPYRTGHRRELLANQFWGSHDERNARRCLSTTLWRLRRELEPDPVPNGTYLLASPDGGLSFNFSSDHWLDVFAFEEKVRRGTARAVPEMDDADAQMLEDAQKLYMGELLEDCYGDWVFRERERFNLLYLNSLARLMGYYDHHRRYEQSLACAQKILAIDPLREQVHRHIMRLYMKSGQRALAVQQYEMCRAVLEEELHIQPMAETQALRNEIVSTLKPSPAISGPSSAKPGTLQHALQQLGAAIRNLDQAQEQLQQAKMMVAHFTERRPLEDVVVE
jgi:DNA-binding SARP family transcriptional activator